MAPRLSSSSLLLLLGFLQVSGLNRGPGPGLGPGPRLGPGPGPRPFLRSKRANSFLLEELRQGNLERECLEENCSYEEAREVFEDHHQTARFWARYYDGDQCESAPCSNGGNCTDGVGGFYCTCPAPFFGKTCELGPQSRPKPDSDPDSDHGMDLASSQKGPEGCQTSGPASCEQLCTASDFRVSCSCLSGFRLKSDGRHCEPQVEFPCGQIPDQLLINSSHSLCTNHRCPWQVSVLDWRGVQLCWGALLGQSVVLTSAHCLQSQLGPDLDPNQIFIRLIGQRRALHVRSVDVHERFSLARHDYDLALLHTARPLHLGPALLHLCVPAHRDHAENVLMHAGKQLLVGSHRSGTRSLALEECRQNPLSHGLSNKMFCLETWTAPGLDQETTGTALRLDQETTRTTSGLDQDQETTRTASGLDQDQETTRTAPGLDQETTGTALRLDQETTRTASGLDQDQKTTRTASGLDQDQETTRTASGLDQDHRTKPELGQDQTQDHRPDHRPGADGRQNGRHRRSDLQHQTEPDVDQTRTRNQTTDLATDQDQSNDPTTESRSRRAQSNKNHTEKQNGRHQDHDEGQRQTKQNTNQTGPDQVHPHQDQPGLNQDRPGLDMNQTRSNQDRPERNQDQPRLNQGPPSSNQDLNQDRPRSNQDLNQDRPRSNQDLKEDQPRSNQDLNQDRPKSNQDRPRSNQDPPGLNQDWPERNQDRPRSNQALNQDRPRSNQALNQDRPRSNQDLNQDRPRSNQDPPGLNQDLAKLPKPKPNQDQKLVDPLLSSAGQDQVQVDPERLIPTQRGPDHDRSKPAQPPQQGCPQGPSRPRVRGLFPGAPAVSVDRGTAYLVGLLTSTAPAGGSTHVLVFTKLSRHMSWLQRRLGHMTPPQTGPRP